MANRIRNKYAWIIALLVFVPLILSGPTTLHAQEGGGQEGTDWSAPLKWTVPGLMYTGVETAAEAGKKIVTEEAGSTVAQAAGNFVGRGLISFAAFITWLGGTIFDYAMKEYVLEFGQNVAALKSTLNTLWTLVRDVCNLAFVFGFIYIGISTIINPDSASMKRFLSRIIIGAILINFSLYFTQVVIDFTNFTATQIYTSMGVTEDKSIMVAFRTHMGLSTLWDDDPETTERLADSSASFAYYIFGATVLLVAGLTFGITGILLIVRFIELFLIMIFSPIIFAARIFPQTEDYSKKIIKKLLAVSFFAPAYMLLIYVALTIANALVAPPQEGGSMKEVILSGVKENPNALTVIINYCIVIILLWSSLSLAKKLGSTGGDMAISLSEKARKGAQGAMNKAATYVPRAGARYAVGRTSETLLNRFDRWQARPNNQQSRLGRVTRGALAFTDTDNTIRGTLTQGTQARMGLSQSYEQRQGVPATRRRRLNQTAAEVRNEEQFENALGTATNATGNLTQATNDLRTAVERLTDAQRQELDIPTLTNTRTALNLTDAHITALDNSGSFTAQEIQQIRDARTQARNNIVNYGDAGGDPTDPRITPQYAETQRRQLLRGNAAQIPVDFLASPNMAPYITPTMLGGRLAAGIEANDEARIRTNLEGYVNGLPLNDRNLNAWRQWATNTPIGIAFALNVP